MKNNKQKPFILPNISSLTDDRNVLKSRPNFLSLRFELLLTDVPL